MSNNILPVALWLENQVDIAFDTIVPTWVGQLMHAHSADQVRVIAHEQTAYAKAGLPCHVLTGALWLDENVMTQLEQSVSNAAAVGAQKAIVILPSRASSELWAQWLLVELPRVNAQFDELITLVQLDRDWGHLSQGLAADKLMLADRVLSFNDDEQTSSFAAHMRALNPLAMWIHNGFISEDDVPIPFKAYGVDAPLWREPLKKEDLLAWGAEKVVYFSLSKPLETEKLKATLNRWRVRYGAKLIRLNAVVNLQGENMPLCIQALQYLWSDDFVDTWPEGRTPETQVWISGQGLPWDDLEADLQQCVA